MESQQTPDHYTITSLLPSKTKDVGFHIYHLDRFLMEAKHLSEAHRHEFYTFILPYWGSGSHTIDFESYELVPGRLFFINYDQLHSWDLKGQLGGYLIVFSKTFFNLVDTQNDPVKNNGTMDQLPTYVDLPEEELPSWNFLFESIELEFIKSEKFSRELICLYLKAAVLKMQNAAEKTLQPKAKSDHKANQVERFKALVSQHFKELKSSKDYAALLSITPNYLNAISNEILGKSAGTVIKNRVILEAKRLLTHSDLTIRQIGLELGFSDNSHFGKYFRKDVGKTPSNFRDSTKA